MAATRTLPDADLRSQQSAPSQQPPKIRPAHPRDQQLYDAGLELQGYLTAWAAKYNLTVYEYLHVLSVAQFRQIQGLCLREREELAKQLETLKSRADNGTPAPEMITPTEPAPRPLLDVDAPAG